MGKFSGQFQKRRKRTCGGRVVESHGETRLVGLAGGFHSRSKGSCHTDRIFCGRDGSIHKHSVGSHLQGLGGMAGSSDSRIHNDGDGRLFDDNLNLGTGIEAPIASNR